MVRTRPAALAPLALLTLAALAAGGCSLFSGPGVAILGDSITVVSASHIGDALGSYDPDIRAILGVQAGPMLPAAQAAAGNDPEQVVIELGSNDVLHGAALDATSADLAKLVATFPKARCIHVVNINTHMTNNGKPVADRAAQLNAAIAKLPAADPRVSIIDWDKVISDDIAAHPPKGLLLDDTVHPDTPGQAVLADQIKTALDACHK